jgi:glutathione reductase (NADPH)
MPREYDVIALGSGSAGYTVASRCGEAGRSVALVEAREFGGTCPLRGCNPQKGAGQCRRGGGKRF